MKVGPSLGHCYAKCYPEFWGTGQAPRQTTSQDSLLGRASDKRQPCEDGSEEEVLGRGHSMCKGPDIEGDTLSSRKRGGWYSWETGFSGYGVEGVI